MKKQEYFEISERKGLPSRCPILNQCERRALTIYLSSYIQTDRFNDYIKCLKDAGEIDEFFEKTIIKYVGEAPHIQNRGDYVSFGGFCPEVHLFDSAHRMGNFRDLACVSGDWDKYRKGNEVTIHECRHYSVCPEFSKYVFDNNLLIANNASSLGAKKLMNSELNSLKSEVKKLIASAKIKDAFNLLNESDIVSDEYKDDIILLSGKFEMIDKESVLGKLTPEEVYAYKSQISSSLLSVINSL